MTTRSGARAVPSKATLNRYGLTAEAWLAILDRQGGVCPICLTSGRQWNVDHHWVLGWSKMPPEERVKYVRGILCNLCNKYSVPNRLTAQEARRVTEYLEAHEKRLNG